MTASATSKLSVSKEDSPTSQLCRWISSITYNDIPPELRTRAKYLILDGLGCALVGSHMPWSEKAAAAIFESESGTPGPAGVIGYNRRISAQNAAVLNSSFIQGSELDDWHFKAPLHSNALLLPALLSAVDHERSKPSATSFRGEDFLLAYIVGLEVGPRVGLALHGLHVLTAGWQSGALFGPSATAASVSKLFGLSAASTEDALGIACSQAGGLASALESEIKRLQHGFAARNGLFSAILARQGFVGIERVYERGHGGFLRQFSGGNGMEPPFKPAEIAKELGTTWQMEGVAIKPTASIAATHNPIDCLKDLQQKYPREMSTLENISHIKIEISEICFRYGGGAPSRPLTILAAPKSCIYTAATYLIDGVVMPAQLAPRMLDREQVWDLCSRMTCELNEDFDKFQARVTVWFKDNSKLSMEREGGRGVSPPLTNEEIFEKWKSMAATVISVERRRKIEEAVLNLDNCPDVTSLGHLLDDATANPLAETNN